MWIWVIWMLSDDLPIDGWKVNPTTQPHFDWALHPHPSEPDVDGLDRQEIVALVERFPMIRIEAQGSRPKVLVAEGDEDGT